MQMLTQEQMKEMDAAFDGVFPEFHPLRDAWLGVLNAVVAVVTLGKGCVMPREPRRAPIVWDGIIRKNGAASSKMTPLMAISGNQQFHALIPSVRPMEAGH